MAYTPSILSNASKLQQSSGLGDFLKKNALSNAITEIEPVKKEMPDVYNVPVQKAQQYSPKEMEFLRQAKQKGIGMNEAFSFIQKQREQNPIQPSGSRFTAIGGQENMLGIPQIPRFSAEQTPDISVAQGYTPGQVGKQFVGNVARSAVNLPVDITNAVVNPMTYVNLAKIPLGAGVNAYEKLTGKDTENPLAQNVENVADVFGDYLKSRFGSMEGFSKAAYTDPVGLFSDIASFVGLAGGVAKGVSKVSGGGKLSQAVSDVGTTMQKMSMVDPANKVIEGVGTTMKYGGKLALRGAETGVDTVRAALGKATGTSESTIGQVFKSAVEGSEEAQKGMRGEINDSTVLENVKSGVESIKEDRRKVYGKGYETLLENKEAIDISKISEQAIKDMVDDLGVVIKDGKLNFSQSKITSKAAQQNLMNIVNDIRKWKDTTPAGLDILKQRVRDYARYTPEFAKSDRFATMVSNKIKDLIVEKVPEYADMMKKYSEVEALLKDIQGAIGNTQKTSTAVTKLKGVLRDNQEFRRAMIEEIEKYSGKDILGQIAGLQMSSLMPRGLAGVGVGLAGVAGVATSILNPSTLIPLLLTSPRVVGEIANALGIGVNKVNKYIDTFKSYYKATDGSTNMDNINSTDSELSGLPAKITKGERVIPVKSDSKELIQASDTTLGTPATSKSSEGLSVPKKLQGFIGEKPKETLPVKEAIEKKAPTKQEITVKDTRRGGEITGEPYKSYIIEKQGNDTYHVYTKNGIWNNTLNSLEDAYKYIDNRYKTKQNPISKLTDLAKKSQSLEEFTEKAVNLIKDDIDIDNAINDIAIKQAIKNKDYDYVQALADIYHKENKPKLPLKTAGNGEQVSKKVSLEKKDDSTPTLPLKQSFKGGVEGVKPNNQLKFNQGEHYEAVRLVVNDKDAMVARYGALDNKDKMKFQGKGSGITDTQKMEMKQIEKQLDMSPSDIIKRHQFLKDEAKKARSANKEVVIEIKDDFRDKLDQPTTPKGMETLYEEARKYKSAEEFEKVFKDATYNATNIDTKISNAAKQFNRKYVPLLEDTTTTKYTETIQSIIEDRILDTDSMLEKIKPIKEKLYNYQKSQLRKIREEANKKVPLKPKT